MSSKNSDTVRATCLKRLGKMIESLRQSSRWSLHDLWLKTGVSPSAVSAVESGEDWPADDDRERICEFVGLKVDTLAKLIAQASPSERVDLPVPSQPTPTTSNVVSFKEFKRSDGKGSPHKGA